MRACGRVWRVDVRVEDGKSFDVRLDVRVEDGKSFDVLGDCVLAGEARKRDGYFGWITVRK